MKLGFSEATICITKRGPGCREQGELCQDLGPDIAPLVLRLLDDGYEMEILETPKLLEWRNVAQINMMLETRVWTRPSREPNNNWLMSLIRWSQESPWVRDAIATVYAAGEPVDGYSMIHGDPTLANVMMRDNMMILTDPMPRTRFRPEIPSRSAVDVGKLLQSLTGWEHVQGVRNAPQGEEDRLLDDLPNSPWTHECILWASIHTARLARRATQKQNALIAGWAQRKSIMFAEILKRRTQL